MSALVVGVPSEIKDNEKRVALTPDGGRGAGAPRSLGPRAVGRGVGSRFSDDEYAAAGAKLVAEADEVFAAADLIVKVKEPVPAEYSRFRPGQQLFTYLHLAADRGLTEFLLERQIDSIAYETVQTADRKLPLLTPMSEVAGRMAVQAAAHHLESPNGGAGILLGGVPGTPGRAGAHHRRRRVGHRGREDRPRHARHGARARHQPQPVGVPVRHLRWPAGPRGPEPGPYGGVRRRGRRRHRCRARPGRQGPEARQPGDDRRDAPGSVVVDIAIDQGGCFETSRPTTHSQPTYVEEGVTHYCVANIPGAVARTSTLALTSATLPYLVTVARHGVTGSAKADPALRAGLSTLAGKLVSSPVAEAHELPFTDPGALLDRDGQGTS
jgi:alanine dehydrogenase